MLGRVRRGLQGTREAEGCDPTLGCEGEPLPGEGPLHSAGLGPAPRSFRNETCDSPGRSGTCRRRGDPGRLRGGLRGGQQRRCPSSAGPCPQAAGGSAAQETPRTAAQPAELAERPGAPGKPPRPAALLSKSELILWLNVKALTVPEPKGTEMNVLGTEKRVQRKPELRNCPNLTWSCQRPGGCDGQARTQPAPLGRGRPSPGGHRRPCL